MKRLVVWGACLGLTGCITNSLEELRQVEPSGNAFQKALFQHYKYFAQKEEQQYDWVDAMYFADKGLHAAYGKETSPENLEDWDIDPKTLPIMQTARHALVELLASGAKETMPEVAARAQYYFDCWVEEQEEGWQNDDISYCREGFKDTMDLLMGKEPPEKDIEASVPPAEPEEPYISNIPALPKEQTYIVFFEQQNTAFTPSGTKTIREAIENIEEYEDFQVVLNAYTDTVGDQESNQKLSQMRAQSVREALVDGGVDESKIRLFAFGESDIPAKTADNIDEPANQRVEIFISQE